MRTNTLLRRATAIGVGVTLGYLSFTYGIAVLRISGSSMEPSLHAGTVIVVLRPWLDSLVTGSSEPTRGDVVVVTAPHSSDRVVKRVVATGGQTVAMQDGRVLVDGEPVGAAVAGPLAGHHSFPAETVPLGHVFVLGDNRLPLASRDSRSFGPVPVASVRGRVLLPLSER